MSGPAPDRSPVARPDERPDERPDGDPDPRPDPAADTRSDDDRDLGWGDDLDRTSPGEDRDARWYEEQRPPHWE